MYIFDSKDYQHATKTLKRNAVRAIIWKGDKLALIESEKYHDVKFPGGGIHENEDPILALIREVEEETGLLVVQESIKEYAVVREIRKSIFNEEEVFDMVSTYYICDVFEERGQTNLDPYEVEYGYHLVYLTPEEAIVKNNQLKLAWVKRENFILGKLRKGEQS